MKNRSVLVTGAAGFIGSHLVDRLLLEDYKVVGIDNFNDYYDPKIKEGNIKNALKFSDFKIFRNDILDYSQIEYIVKQEEPNIIVHLAARAGVRPSLENPNLYSSVNIEGTVNMLKIAVDNNINRFIFGSSSSVYGNSNEIPYREDNMCNYIISPYGASKRAAEVWVESFYKSYGLNSIIFRFFTVYGPRGRPDMAPAIFTNAVLKNNIINQYGDGTSSRDYTYVDDIVDGIVKSINTKIKFEIINLGNSHSIKLSELISTIENITYKRAHINVLGKQLGDVDRTWANISVAKILLNWSPKTNIKDGMKKYFKFIMTKN